ncbi:S-adenosylmethionine decarboxylase, partial [Pelagophyceae sp. CCMP2097]
GKFEGPEKTLEVCFSPDVGHENGCRALSRRALDSILDEARCTILSKASNSYLDAYVLSESSLFVYPWKVVIKTCGRTTLLRCLRRLLEHTTCDAAGAEPALGLRLEWVGYSRKNYAFPDEQPSPHTSFGEELAYLKAHCDDTFGASNVGAFDGQGYVLGPITGDHWFVYVADECERPASSSTERTINIMMFDLADDVRDAFYVCDDEKDDLAQAARNMTQRSGLARLVRETFVDAAAFEPCGYSMNALCFESYTTVHVTPEKTCSYASFETNTALKSYASLVKNVIAVFKPKRVVLTLFADEAGLAQLPRNATFDGLPVLDVRSVGTYARSDFSSLLVEQDCVCMMANYVFVDPN